MSRSDLPHHRDSSPRPPGPTPRDSGNTSTPADADGAAKQAEAPLDNPQVLILLATAAFDVALYVAHLWPDAADNALAPLFLGLAPYRGAANAFAFLLLLSTCLLRGFVTHRALNRWTSARWTADGELFAWQQRRDEAWEEGWLDTIWVLGGQLSDLAFLAVPLYFVLDGPDRQTFFWLGISLLLPGSSVGKTIFWYLVRPRTPVWVTILKGGVIVAGLLFPWGKIGSYRVDESRRAIHLYAATPARVEIGPLWIPDATLFTGVLDVLRAELPPGAPVEEVPWYLRRLAWGFWLTALYLAACLVTLLVVLVPSRDLACVVLVGAYLLLFILRRRSHTAMLGREIGMPGEGLQKVSM